MNSIESEHWVVDATNDAPTFFRSLARLAPAESVLYMEGSTESHVPKHLATLRVAQARQVRLGTIMPPSDRYQVIATPESLNGLAKVIEDHRISAPAIHVVLHDSERVLVSWYDAFTEDPMFVSARFTEQQVREFAGELGVGNHWRTDHA
ncbi:MAG: hypothetical protein ABIU54_11575 [Candidatus Eisenbacteria bacterium]